MKKMKLLIVDDEKGLRESLVDYLEERFEVLEAESAATALDFISREEIELAMLDVRLPDMNGLDLLFVLKHFHPSCKVIVMTAYSSPGIRLQAEQKGAIYYLEKPFELSHLDDALSSLLSSQEGYLAGTIRNISVGDVVQLMGLSGRSGIICVSSGSGNGEIFINRGRIESARWKNIAGMEAIVRMLDLVEGEFEVRLYTRPADMNLGMDWEPLLMDAYRMVDEMRESQVDLKETDDPSPVNTPSRVVALLREGLHIIPKVLMRNFIYLVLFDLTGKVIEEINSKAGNAISSDELKIRLSRLKSQTHIDEANVKAWAVPLKAGSFTLVVLMKTQSALPLLRIALRRLEHQGITLRIMDKTVSHGKEEIS